MKVSFVIPCYRSSQTLPGVIDEIQTTMKTMPKYSYEVILVNDCSPDETFETIRGLAAENFGQHSATFGIDGGFSRGKRRCCRMLG